MDEHALDVEALLAEQNWLRALARRLTRDDASADDLVQETWLAALRRPPEGGRPLRPWLAQVLANFAKMRVRREGGVARRERAVAHAEAVPDASALVERAEVQRRLARFVLDLDEPFRATVLLRYYEGLSSAEIARRSGVPAGTVRWRLKQGIERLRTHLDHEHDGERGAWCALLAPLAGERAVAASLAGVPAALLAGVGALALAGLATLLWPLLSSGSGDGERTALAPAAPAAGLGAAALDAPEERDARRPVASPPAPQGLLSLELEARVVDAAGQPLAGARLTVQGLPAPPALSAADGRVRLSTQAPPLAFEAPYVLELVHPACARRERRTALAPGRLNQLGDLALSPGGGVSGRVVDGLGQALAGARVRLEVLPSRWQATLGSEPLEDARIFDSMLGEDVPAATTDTDGRFAFAGQALGHVRLWAQQPGLLGDYSAPVAVRAGETSPCADLVLAAAGDELCIAGRVVGPAGDHVPGAEIEVSRASTQSAFFCGEPWVVRTRAGPDGRFRAVVGAFPNYDLAARDPGRVLAPLVLRRLKAGTGGLQVRLEPARALTLDVRGPRGEALPGARAQLVDARTGRTLATSATSDRPAGIGPLAVPWVPFRVLVSHAGCQPADLGPFLPERVAGELVVRLDAAPRLAGRVRSAAAPLAGARLELLAALPAGQHAVHGDETADGAGLCARVEHALALATAVSDAEGRFAFDGIRAGRGLVRAEAPGFAPVLLGPLELSTQRAQGSLQVELTPGGAIEGRVLGADGAPLVGRSVGAANGDGYAKGARTDAEGRYKIENLAPGAWQVRELALDLAAGGWGRLASAPTWIAQGEPRFDCTVAEGATTSFDVRLSEPRAALLRGRLLLAGAPPGAWLVLLARAGDEPSAGLDTGLDAGGRFELRVPAPGRYRLSLWNTGLLPLAISVQDTLELVAGPNAWELDLPTAELALSGLPVPQANDALTYYLWEGAGELYCATLLAPAADGTLVLPQAPAGPGRIVRAKGAFGRIDPRTGRTLKRIELEAGGVHALRLP